jgi:hypothetical protein
MEGQQRRLGVGGRRGPDRRSSGERRIGNGRRTWNRRIEVVPVEQDRREVARRVGSSRRGAVDRAAELLGGLYHGGIPTLK